PQQRGVLHPAAGGPGVLVGVLRGHRPRAGVHLAVDDPGAHLLLVLREADRRWSHGRRQGLTRPAPTHPPAAAGALPAPPSPRTNEGEGLVSDLVPAMPAVSQRVRHLHAQMSLEEKLAQLVGYWLDQNGSVAPMQSEMSAGQAPATRLAEITRDGVGHYTRVYGTRPVDPAERAG